MGSNGDSFWLSATRELLEALPTPTMLLRAEPEGLVVAAANARCAPFLPKDVDTAVGLGVEAALGPLAATLNLSCCALILKGDSAAELGCVETDEGEFEVRAMPLVGGVGLCFEPVAKGQALLRDDALFLHEIVEHLPDMIFVKDADELRFLQVNRAAEAILGFSRDQLLGKNDHDFFPKEEADFFNAKDREVLASGELLDIPEEPVHTASEGVRWLHTKKIPISNGERRFLLGISQDITEAKQISEDLARSHEDMKQFAHAASHDLKEPLRKIVAYCEMLRVDHRDKLDDEGRGLVRRIGSASERMQALVGDLLELSRAMRPEGERSMVALGEVCVEVLEDLDYELRESGVALEVGVLPEVEGYSRQYQQLVQNLISNAIKFRRRGVRSSIRIFDGTDMGDLGPLPPQWCRLVVEDNGIGFEPKDAARIFQPFERLHGRSAYSGTGMGLAICQRIVERHRGRIRALSRPGMGTKFVVELPRATRAWNV